jgi:LPS sulfotransferase NodH
VTTFDEVAGTRRAEYAKDAGDEAFLRAVNERLESLERERYVDTDIEHPFLFVVGLPRSGTTLLSQLLAYCLDVGYVDNVAARFWLAPVHGLRLSRILVGNEKPAAFESDYARTHDLRAIHEFGYFWRRWLRKETFADVARSRELESEIDWDGLRLTLANVQRQLGRPYAGKNMLGAYHTQKLTDVLGKVLWVYVERDPLDVCVSILDARRKHYDDLRTWWSYVPLEIDRLEGLDEWQQVAGQVHYLQRLYDADLPALGERALQMSYEELCRDPRGFLAAVSTRCEELYGEPIAVTQPPPESFPVRKHEGRDEEKARFAKLLERFAGDTE